MEVFSRLYIREMLKLKLLLPWQFLFIIIHLFHFSHADVGSAAQYSPPYLPTACYGSYPSQFPSNNLFAAAGERIWDNGAACGRHYLVRCISAAVPKTCIAGQIILIKIVDRAVSKTSKNGTTMVLSTTAYEQIAKGQASSIIVEFHQL